MKKAVHAGFIDLKRNSIWFYKAIGRFLFSLGRKYNLKNIETDPKLETFCILPWTHFFTSEKGNNFPCCISTGSQIPNTNNFGRKYQVFNESEFTQSWNSDYMKEIRRDMLSGKRPKACDVCYKFEDLGIFSHREWANQAWHARVQNAIEKTKPDGHFEMKLYSADIRLGNQCNLRCRMCSPVSSRGLVNDWKDLTGISEKESKELLSLDWFEKPEFWDLFLKHSKDLEALHFAGGEPFIIKQHFVFLRNIIDQGFAGRIALSYNTNMTMLPPELLELWKHFKSVQIMASLDGTSEVNHYIRSPSNWIQINKNIKFIHDNMKEYNILYLNFNVTVQAYNIFNIPDLVDFILSEYPKAAYPNLSLLFEPEELSIQILPEQIKDSLTKHLTSYLERNKESWLRREFRQDETKAFIDNFEGVINFLNKEDRSHLLQKFKLRTRIFDKNRKQFCGETVPELAFLFENKMPEQSSEVGYK